MRFQVVTLAVFVGLGLTLATDGGILAFSTRAVDRVTIDGLPIPITTRYQTARTIISAPYIRTSSGEYLSYEMDGDSPRVFYTKEKGPNAVWSVIVHNEFTQKLRVERIKGHEFDVSLVGFNMTLKAGAGARAGWYLSLNAVRELELTKDAMKAGKIRVESYEDYKERPR